MNTNTPVRVLRAPVSRFAGIPVPYQPRDRAMTLVAALQRLEGLQELMLAKLIAELDAIEAPTFDLEDDEREIEPDEHNLGWENPLSQARICAGSNDLEPALGAPERPMSVYRYSEGKASSQVHWAQGRVLEEDEETCEDEGADVENQGEYSLGWSEGESESGRVPYAFPKDDEEPSLGSTHNFNQRLWAEHEDPESNHVLDGEEDCNDEGVDTDSEPDEPDAGIEYADEGMDQRFVIFGQFGDQTFYRPVGVVGA